MKILMICNTDGALYVFRKPIIKRLLEKNHSVCSLTSKGIYHDDLIKLGVKTYYCNFSNHSISPFKNLRIIIDILKVIKIEKPEILHNFTHKPAIYGTLLAKFLGVKRIFVTITGLGKLFSNNDIFTKILRFLLLLQYMVVLKLANKVFFQNPDDMRYFINNKILIKDKAILTAGSGIDLKEFKIPFKNDINKYREILSKEIEVDIDNKIIIVFTARSMKEKGLYEFYNASKIINQCTNKYIFLHFGLVSKNSNDIFNHDNIHSYAKKHSVFYLGYRKNIIDYIVASDVVVLPSYYREGIPRSLIEALALDKFIITTNTPGCKETIKNGWNGYFCKPRDTGSLVSQIFNINHSTLNESRMRSRRLCEEKYDVEILINETFRYYFPSIIKKIPFEI